MTHKDEDEIADRTEIDERIAEADRIASRRIDRPYQQGDRLRVILHEGDDVAQAMEKALAEHVACHPEDAGRRVGDFRWIVHEIVSSLRCSVHNARRAREAAAKMRMFVGHDGLGRVLINAKIAASRSLRRRLIRCSQGSNGCLCVPKIVDVMVRRTMLVVSFL